jgi:phasin
MTVEARATKPVDLSNGPQDFREIAEKGTAQAKETYAKMNAASTETADLIRNSYSTAVKGMQDYNNKVMEFARANTDASFDFVQRLSSVKSSSVFVELWTEYVRNQVETLTEQSRQLVALAQKATLATEEPFKTGVGRAFNHTP